MITKEIKNLFEFIEFLHSNIDNFKKYDKIIKQLYDLGRQRSKLNPRNNFKDKLRYDKIQTEIKEKIKPVKKNIIEKIQYETKKNDIYDWNTDNINGKVALEIHKLKDSFNDDDIPIIILHKKRYIEFRTKTNYTYFNDFFFNELDEQLKVLFDFFNESTVNEFEAFEQLQKGNKKLSLPIDLSNDNKPQTSSIEQKEIELNNILDEQNNLIPKVSIKEVYEHFKVLIKNTNKNNEFYLTKEQLLIFIKSTFIDKIPIQQELKKPFKKKEIRKLFYLFYNNCKNKENNQSNLKRKYFNILNDAFYGFNKNDYNDFHKI